MKRVVLACTPSSVYDFFLPIAARVWRKRIGYEPVILLVGTAEEWSRGSSGVPLQAITSDGHKVEFIERVTGVDDSNVCMSSRQHAAALPWLDPEDILIVGDVDLLPVRKSFYHQHNPLTHQVAIHHAGMYQDKYWPSYGPSMSVENWRKTMGLRVGDLQGSLMESFWRGDIEGIIRAQKADHLDSRLWTFDEEYASARLRATWLGSEIHKIQSLGYERLCRNAWPSRVYMSNYIDCHCRRPGYTDENWPKIREVLAQILPDDLSWVDGYVSAYRNAIGLSLPKSGVPIKAEKSNFDSDVFGCNVGILKCSEIPGKFSIQEANRSNLDVVFVKADGWQVPDDVVSALDYCFEMELKSKPVEFNQAIVRCDFVRPSHVAIAKVAFPDSRFLRDPRLTRKTDALYERWLTSASSVYALEPVENDAFMVVTEDPDGAGRISLLAVLDKSRGIGIGEALVNGVMSKPSAAGTWRVKVSCRNVRGIRFYEKLGFRIKSVHTAFHVWTSGDEG